MTSLRRKRSNLESYSLPFMQNGMDGDRNVAAQCAMGQVFPSADVRCERCDALKVVVKPIDGKGPRALRCPKCNELDPLRLPTIAGWMDGELRAPK
jgi:hypothetical protein